MGNFEKSNWNWQIEQWGRRFREWVEFHFFPQTIPDLDWSFAEWLVNGMIWLAWAILGGIILWIFWQLGQILYPYLQTIGWLKPQTAEKAPIATPSGEWEQRSQILAAQGEYRQACYALYMAMLQRLHEATLAPQQLSRTDGEYLQLLRQIPRWQTYQVLLSTHERLCFNNEILSVLTFEDCQQAYQELTLYLNTNRP